jgi:partitioning defective protein 3
VQYVCVYTCIHIFYLSACLRSQDVFRNALQEPEIYIRILPTSRAEVKAATVEVKVTVPSSSSSTGATGLLPSLSSFQPATSRAAGEKSVDGSPPAGMIDSGSEKKVPPPAVPARNPGTILSSMIDGTKLTSVANTRRIGKKFQVRLLKGADGLGFSVTSRDTPAWGSAPIYIKTILPTGAAIKTGLIKPGDRLLQVNDVDLTGKTQPDTVNLLRSIPQGTVVQLLLSRQVDDEDNNADGAAENSVS